MCDLFARAIRKHSFANQPPLQLLSANQNFANAQTHLRILLKLQYKYAQTAPQIFISNFPTFKFSNNQSSPSLISKLRSLGEARHPEGRGPGPRRALHSGIQQGAATSKVSHSSLLIPAVSVSHKTSWAGWVFYLVQSLTKSHQLLLTLSTIKKHGWDAAQ
jgi:hypothetical protein